MKAINYEQAKKQAQANADYFGYAFCVLISTSGGIFIERFYQPAEYKAEVFFPKEQENRVLDKSVSIDDLPEYGV